MESMPESPYETPQSQIVTPSAGPPPIDAGPPPSAIKVFGILHLILAGIGILSGVWTVLTILFFKDFLGWMNRVSGGRQPEYVRQAQLDYMTEMAWLTWLQLAVSVVLTVFLVIAGVRLLKRRDSGRVWSIRYGWTSVISKVATLLLMLLYGLPAASRMNEAVIGNRAPGAEQFTGILTTVSTLVGIASTMIYPILVIAILNGRRVREYLEGR